MSLKILKEISSVVTNYTKKPPFEGVEKGTKLEKLLSGLLKNSIDDDQQAMHAIYGKPLIGRSLDMLKSRTTEQLINTIFTLDTSSRFKSSYDRAYFSACKKLIAGLILSRLGKDNSAISFIKSANKTASEYHFSEIEYWSNKHLKYFSSLFGQTKMFRSFSKKEATLLKRMQAEAECDNMNQEIILEYVSSAATKDQIKGLAERYFYSCKEILSKHDTYSIRLNYYRIGIRYFDSCNQYNNLIDTANECLEYLEANPHLAQRVRKGEMTLHQLYASLHLRDYLRGKSFAENCFSLFNAGTLNWLIFLEYYFLLTLHTNNPNKAQEVYNQVIGHNSFKSYSPLSKEKWKIFEAFLHYALPETRENKKRFNTARFINEVPIFSKDKAGYNLSIIIAQVILLIKAGEFEKVVEKAEALKLYASRYIKKEKSPRSYYFIKMLLVMIKYDFEPSKTEEIAEKFFVKLKATHMGEQNQLETLEVIPYDLLWPRLLEQLRKNG